MVTTGAQHQRAAPAAEQITVGGLFTGSHEKTPGHTAGAAHKISDDSYSPSDFRRALRGAGLTHGEYRVAVELSEFTVTGQPVVWPSNSSLAEICGMTRRGVQTAIRALQRAGVVVNVSPSKGGRGQTNRLRLVVYNPGNREHRFAVTSVETVNEGSRFGIENCERNDTKLRTRLHETANHGSHEVGKEVGKEVGGARDAGAAPTAPGPPPRPQTPDQGESARVEQTGLPLSAPPPRFCPDHPNDTNKPCVPCRAAREAYERWEQENVMATQSEKNRHWDLVAACGLCDAGGWRKDHGGYDSDRPRKCDHGGRQIPPPDNHDFSEPRHPPAVAVPAARPPGITCSTSAAPTRPPSSACAGATQAEQRAPHGFTADHAENGSAAPPGGRIARQKDTA